MSIEASIPPGNWAEVEWDRERTGCVTHGGGIVVCWGLSVELRLTGFCDNDRLTRNCLKLAAVGFLA